MSAPIEHIVLFKTDPSVYETILAKIKHLQTNCVLPTTQQPYIAQLKLGLQNSPEGAGRGFNVGFVMTFHNEQDRAYYIDHDPIHQSFKDWAKGVVQDVLVFDFTHAP